MKKEQKQAVKAKLVLEPEVKSDDSLFDVEV